MHVHFHNARPFSECTSKIIMHVHSWNAHAFTPLYIHRSVDRSHLIDRRSQRAQKDPFGPLYALLLLKIHFSRSFRVKKILGLKCLWKKNMFASIKNVCLRIKCLSHYKMFASKKILPLSGRIAPFIRWDTVGTLHCAELRHVLIKNDQNMSFWGGLGHFIM